MPMSTSQRARIAALTRWSRESPVAQAEAGQQGLREKFARQARDADPELIDEAEIARRADVLYRLHMQRMAIEREAARRKSKARAGT